MGGLVEGIFGSPQAPTPQVSQAWSPQQQQLYGMAQPVLEQGLSGQGYQVPQMPQWGGYEVPQMPGGLAPSRGWYGNLDPNVRAGIEEPYMRQMDMMQQRFGGMGQLGAPGAGMSGAAADVFGQYAQQAAPAMAQTGWGMMAPQREAAMQGWGANLQQNIMGAQMPYQGAMTGWQAELAKRQMPFQMAQGLMGAAMPENIVTTPPPNPWSQMLPNLGMGLGMGLGGSMFK